MSAFARIDLLVMLVMAAVLVTLGTAATSNNRAGSQVAGCLSNLRQLNVAFQEYTTDLGHFPPSPDDGNVTPGFNWIPGNSGPGGPQEFNPDILKDPSRSLLYRYLREQDAQIFRCPADPRAGRYQGTDLAKRNQIVPAARTYAMSHAVGIDPYTMSDIPVAVNGPWLDNTHSHLRGQKWKTYARFEDVTDPAPGNLMVFVDEDEYSINDGTLAFGMESAEWIDWPTTRHNLSGTFGFADGHVELRHWVDPTTVVTNRNVSRHKVPGSPDYEWLRDRTSARIRR